ncbi:hypothetical protein Pfo_016342 [Paulownia fortunei]|nr:hypothetical protein Pfo_016342 [Paulownia fortunei]
MPPNCHSLVKPQMVGHSLRQPPDFDELKSKLEEDELVLVRDKAFQENVDRERVEKISREEAVCRFCFNKLEEDHNVLKTKCRCRLTLIHQDCAIKWSTIKCDVCKQDIQTIPVTISMSCPEKAQKPKSLTPNSTYWNKNQIIFHIELIYWNKNQIIFHIELIYWNKNQIIFHIELICWNKNQIIYIFPT